jgi:hypothetical protein
VTHNPDNQHDHEAEDDAELANEEDFVLVEDDRNPER